MVGCVRLAAMRGVLACPWGVSKKLGAHTTLVRQRGLLCCRPLSRPRQGGGMASQVSYLQEISSSKSIEEFDPGSD